MVSPSPLGLYVHWPFCLKKCPYCDFNSYVADGVNHQMWVDALVAELKFYAEKIEKHPLTSVFFGGGTPSLMLPETVATIVETAHSLFGFKNNIEITLEANPTSFEQQKFREYIQAGVNRFSLGVQSLNDNVLQFLGRTHSARDAMSAIDTIKNITDRWSFDLIYARPDQTWENWQGELEQALSFQPQHLSLYQLTIEPNTQFYHDMRHHIFTPLNDDGAADMFLKTRAVLEERGLPAYEVSNHAVKGQESQHNLLYWRYYDVIGIGPGAHGRLHIKGKRYATREHQAPDIWLKKVFQNGNANQTFNPLSQQEQNEERLMMGLRLKEGVVWEGKKDLTPFINEGLILYQEGKVIATEQGILKLNALIGSLLHA